MRKLLLGLTFLALAGCGDEKGDDHVKCDAPGGCAAVHSTLKTGEVAFRAGSTHIGRNIGRTDLWVIAIEPK